MRFSIFSLEEFLTAIKTPIASFDDDYTYFYRGCATHDWEYNLVPGAYRSDNIYKEHINFRELIIKSPADFASDHSTLEKLVKMQHYTLPTRLLDITSNPLVALYFASGQYGTSKSDGIVYVLKIKNENIKYFDSDSVSLIANLAKLKPEKTDFTDDFRSLIHEIRAEKPYYQDNMKGPNETDIQSVFPVKAKLNNNRIIRQSGAFLIFGMEGIRSKIKPASLPGSIEVQEIKVDFSSKEGILNYLNALSINDNTLFPEL